MYELVHVENNDEASMDYWCDTQCADGLKCPTNVCACDGSVQLRATSQRAPTAPTWEDAHPSKVLHEIDLAD